MEDLLLQPNSEIFSIYENFLQLTKNQLLLFDQLLWCGIDPEFYRFNYAL